MFAICESFIYNLGLFAFFFIVIAITARLVLRYLKNESADPNPWRPGPQSWTVITGATDGIGLAFARQLAAKGYNLLLLSRSQDKLDNVKAEIEGRQKVRVLAVDFTRTDIYDKIETELKKLPVIDVLVNNVGITYTDGVPEYYADLTKVHGPNFIADMMNVNCMSCARLTALVLPAMLAKGRGIIINLGSTASLTPGPLLTLYYATKSFIDSFTRSLRQEYADKSIIIQCLLPGLVKSKMTVHFERPDFFMPTPDSYVFSALKTVGREDRTSGFIGHKIFHQLLYFLSFVSYILGVDVHAKILFLELTRVKNNIIKQLHRND